MKSAPPDAIHEIITHSRRKELRTRKLGQLAQYLMVRDLTLAQLLHDPSVPQDALWDVIEPAIEGSSYCRTLRRLYNMPGINDIAHLAARNITFRSRNVVIDHSSITVAGTKFTVPTDFAKHLRQIEREHSQDTMPDQFKERCAAMRRAFRFAGHVEPGKGVRGYSLDSWGPVRLENRYAYIPQNTLANILERVESQAHGDDVIKQGPVISTDKRWLSFFFQQASSTIPSDAAASITESLYEGDGWGGLFPDVSMWGLVCVTDLNGNCKSLWPGRSNDLDGDAIGAPRNSLAFVVPLDLS